MGERCNLPALFRTALLSASLLAPGCVSTELRDGELHHLANPDSEAIERAIADHQIRTVINLCGFAPSTEWYANQSLTCSDAGIRWVDIDANETRVDREEMLVLLDTIQTADRPILTLGGKLKPKFIASALDQADGGSSVDLQGNGRQSIAGTSFATIRSIFPNWKDPKPAPGPQSLESLYDAYGIEDDKEEFVDLLHAMSEPSVPKSISEKRTTHAIGSQTSVREGKLDLRELEGPLGEGVAEFLRVRPTEFTFDSSGSYAFGDQVADYSTVLVNGPVADGPQLIGKVIPTETSKRKRLERKLSRTPSNPNANDETDIATLGDPYAGQVDVRQGSQSP
jgi:hypothetical protein